MTDCIDEIKSVLESLSTSDLTCSARLVAVIHALGIEDPKEIERLTGLKHAGARKARSQLKDYRHSGSATPVARHSSSATTVAKRHSSSGSSRVGAPAHKESPSGININNILPPTTPPKLDVVVVDEREEMIAFIENEWGGFCRSNAENWLLNNTRRLGSKPMADGWRILQSRIANPNEIISKPLRFWEETAANRASSQVEARSNIEATDAALAELKAEYA